MTTTSTAMATPMKSKARPFGGIFWGLIYIMIRKPHLQHNNNDNALPKHCQNMTKGLSITTVAAFLRLLDISKAKFFFFFNASLLILQGQQLHCNQICAKVLLTKLLLGTRVIKQSCCKNREWGLYFYQ